LPAVLAELVGAPVEVIVNRAGPVSAAGGLAGGAGVLIAPASAPRLERGLLAQAEVTLVASVVARVAKHPPPAVLGPGSQAEPGATGAFAAVLVAALRRAHAGMAVRVLAAGPAPSLEADLVRVQPELWAVGLTVLVDGEAFEARIVLPRSAALSAASPAWDAAALAAMGAAPVALYVVAHVVGATAAELGQLARGDVLLLDGWPLARGSAGPAELSGPVVLAAAGATTGISAQLGDGGRLVLRGDVVPLGAAEAEMDEANRGGLIEAVGEAPLTIRVEIGEAVMAAREWATLGRGDVLALGRRVGERVVLRVGGVPVARGELVEIEGEVGVRIVERVGGGGA
jgi:flagellar motor switch/type III secretory pathway protein FliN